MKLANTIITGEQFKTMLELNMVETDFLGKEFVYDPDRIKDWVEKNPISDKTLKEINSSLCEDKILRDILLGLMGLTEDEAIRLVYSPSQIAFIEEAKSFGLPVFHWYSGRGSFGKNCPATKVDSIDDYNFTTGPYLDGMGKQTVVYQR